MSDEIRTDSRYLHGDDLRRDGNWADIKLIVESVGERDSAKDSQGKIIPGWPVTFEKTDKVLVMNQTNTKLAVAAIGTNKRSEWVGMPLTVYPAILDNCFGQTDVICLRIRVPDGVPKSFVSPKHMGKDLTK